MKAWDGGRRPEPRKLGTWTMTQLSDVETGERLVVEIFDGRPMAFRGLTPVAFEDSRALYTLLKENDGIANGAVVFVIDGIVTMELS